MKDSPRIHAELDFLEHEGCILTDQEFQAASQAEKDRYLPPEKGWYLPSSARAGRRVYPGVGRRLAAAAERDLTDPDDRAWFRQRVAQITRLLTNMRMADLVRHDGGEPGRGRAANARALADASRRSCRGVPGFGWSWISWRTRASC
jgi:hypothetical protein